MTTKIEKEFNKIQKATDEIARNIASYYHNPSSEGSELIERLYKSEQALFDLKSLIDLYWFGKPLTDNYSFDEIPF